MDEMWQKAPENYVIYKYVKVSLNSMLIIVIFLPNKL